MAQNYKTFLDDTFSELVDGEEEAVVSFLCDISGIQDSFCYRCQRRSLLLADRLVGEDGELKREEISLEDRFYPRGFADSLLYEHQLKFLKRWNEDDNFFKSFKKFQLPLCHRGAEKLIRETLRIPSNVSLTDGHARKAAIAACLTLLRQNIGSCFATAPAIVIHEEQIEYFLADLYELLTTGKMKRTFGGVEHSVPLSLSWGVGALRRSIFHPEFKIWYSPGLMAAFESVKVLDPRLSWNEKIDAQYKRIVPFLEKGKEMTIEALIRAVVPPAKEMEAKAAFKGVVDNALLKAWEFTLASLSEAKMEFSRWNLYLSLGLHPEEKGGIGEILFHAIDEKLKEAHKQAEQFHLEYAHAFDQMRLSESLLRQASSEREARRLRAEHQGRYYHMQSCKELSEKFQTQAKQYSLFFTFLIKQYDAKFQEYFQEIYDPEMVEFSKDQYDDSPAGFRLVYKHGRTDASLWTPIYDGAGFTHVLVNFFNMTEPYIADACTTDDERKALSNLTSAIILHVRSESFLSAAMTRTAKHGRSPWAYISGGTMETLIKTYYRHEKPIAQESRWVESELDLLIFIIDTLKSLPLSIDNKPMLMNSPTHAFILHPGWQQFCQGWQDSGFTYTWIRDNILTAGKEFYETIHLSKEEQLALMERLSVLFEPKARASITDFRSELVSMKVKDVDTFLYGALPLVPRGQCQAALQQLLEPWIFITETPESLPDYLTSQELQNIAKAYLLRSLSFTGDIHQAIANRARELGLAPRPLLFADTNWTNNYFAFVVNPGTLELELWRMDRTGCVGFPMKEWKSWLTGQEKTPWVIYTNPVEYN